MSGNRTVRFIEPGTRPGRPFNAWIGRWPLLGPLTLATVLNARGYDVAVYNENLSGPLPEDAAAWGDICTADVVGISIMTPTAARGYALADRIRLDAGQAGRRPRIVFGGVHATFCPQEAAAHGDIVVRGEGEEVIEPIAAGEIAGGIVTGRPLADLDGLPALDHSLIRGFERLFGRGGRRAYELPVMASRGCPYGCRYCTVTQMFGRRVRRQSVEKVLADVCCYAERGFRRFFFYDDNLTSDRAWARELCTRLAPLRIRFNAQARADFHWQTPARRQRDDALLRAMRRAGADVLYIGYETIDHAAARAWHKGYSGDGPLADRLHEDTRILHGSGFWIHGMFVLGPQHTRRTADRIVAFARRSAIESLQISILTPFPGTPLLADLRPHLILRDFPADWDFYDGTHCVYGHGRLGVAEFQETVLAAHRKFYGWSGWSPRRLRALAADRDLGAWQRLLKIWDSARTARRTLRAWRAEIRSYLELVRRRMGASNRVLVGGQMGSMPC